MELLKNGMKVYEFVPSYSGKKLILSIDSSKSDTAMIVWDEYGHPLDDYEICGAGSDIDVHQLCWDTRKELDKLFYCADVILVGLEDIITKKEKGNEDIMTRKERGHKGLEIHQSRAKITAVYENFIFYFQDRFNLMPKLINNWAWKAGVLPEEYRKKSHKKGSQDWLTDIGSKWAGRNDNVTDAVCIGWYLIGHSKIETSYEIISTAPASYEYDFGILPKTFKKPEGHKNFVIKNSDTLEHNLDEIANSIKIGQVGCVIVPTESVPIEMIYSDKLKTSNAFKFEKYEKEVLFVVCRK